LEQHKEIDTAPIEADNQLLYEAPPFSVTTFVIENAVFEPVSNIVPSGGFEFGLGLGSGWTAIGNAKSVVSKNYARTGNFSGAIKPEGVGRKVGLLYALEAEGSGEYYLTAWCAGGGSTKATLSVEVNGETVTEVKVVFPKGYHAYGLQFTAVAGDQVNIVFKSFRANVHSYTDDVVLTSNSTPSKYATSSTTTPTDPPTDSSAHSTKFAACILIIQCFTLYRLIFSVVL
jgi:hypothetical protein